MKEIKYRQWIGDKFHYWGFTKKGSCFVAPITFNGSFDDAQKHSQQFSGLKDKNGVEIYEGDIVSVIVYRGRWYEYKNINHSKGNNEFRLNGVVYWEDKYNIGWRIREANKENRIKLENPTGFERIRQHVHFPTEFNDRMTLEKLEVIGNIYENGDLLK